MGHHKTYSGGAETLSANTDQTEVHIGEQIARGIRHVLPPCTIICELYLLFLR